MTRTDRAEAIIVSLLRGERKPSRQELLAAHADLVGVKAVVDGMLPGPRQFDVLLRLYIHEVREGVPALLTEIAEDIGVSPPTLTGVVNKLRSYGFVEKIVPGRIAAPRNVRLTAKGRKWLREQGFQPKASDETCTSDLDELQPKDTAKVWEDHESDD